MNMRSWLIPSLLIALPAALLLGASSPTERAPSFGTPAEVAPVPGMDVLPVLQRAQDIGAADGSQLLTLAVSMPFAHPEEMQAFVDGVSNPHSPTYRQFITPEEVGERFGLPTSQVQQVADYLQASGFTITLVAKTHLSVLASCTVAQAESAFHTTIRAYSLVPQDLVEPSRFIANSTR